MQEVYEFLKEVGYYFIATIEGDQPHVRPFATYALFEGKLYIQTGKNKAVSRQMAANPRIEICAYKPDKFEWVRIEAEAVEDDRAESQQAVMDQFPQLSKRGYAVGDGNMHVRYLKNATATFYNAGGAGKVIRF